MKAIKEFEEFVKRNIVKKQGADRARAEFLVNESEKSYKALIEMTDKIQVNENNADIFIKTCYDILMQLIRAKMLLGGYNASGIGAHEAEVSYMRVLGFNEKDVQFADQMRYFRNGIVYYGKTLDKEYAEMVIDFTKTIYPKLKKLVEVKQ